MKRGSLHLFAAAMLMSGCATTAGVPAPAATYRAVGTEPFWSVTIDGGRMTYDTAEGLQVTAPAASPRTTFRGYRYESEQLTVDVTHGRCSDGMSDRVYADTVIVTVAGRTLNGCGGEIVETSGT